MVTARPRRRMSAPGLASVAPAAYCEDGGLPLLIRIGPAGWSYKDWEGVVYPPEKPEGFHPATYLAWYFDTIEINSTFYRPPEPGIAKSWVRRLSWDYGQPKPRSLDLPWISRTFGCNAGSPGAGRIPGLGTPDVLAVTSRARSRTFPERARNVSGPDDIAHTAGEHPTRRLPRQGRSRLQSRNRAPKHPEQVHIRFERWWECRSPVLSRPAISDSPETLSDMSSPAIAPIECR
jgi:hypothetical protein